MADYKAPLRDMRFVYHELHDCGALAGLPGLSEFTADLVDPVLPLAAADEALALAAAGGAFRVGVDPRR